MPVSSFAPEMLILFQHAAQKPVELTLEDRTRAVHLRHRMHSLRSAMRKEKHPLQKLADGVQFRITPAGNLIAEPVDKAFLSALEKAGVSIPQAPTGAPHSPSGAPGAPIPFKVPLNPGSLSSFSDDGAEGNVEDVLKHFFKKQE